MKFYRITAVCSDDESQTIVLMCPLDGQLRMVDGEWFGAYKDGETIYPFILRHEGRTMIYGWEENYREHTNLGEQPIKVGRYFTTDRTEDLDGPWYQVFQIRSVYPYETL